MTNTMTEKNMILNNPSNRTAVMSPLRKESANPVIRFLTYQIHTISTFLNKLITP
jgi:hypothetical protein